MALPKGPSVSNACGISSLNWLLNSIRPICCTGSICMVNTSNKKYVQIFFRMYACENRVGEIEKLLKLF